MNSRCAASMLFLSVTAISAGCDQSRQGYVDFDATKPSALDERQAKQRESKPDESGDGQQNPSTEADASQQRADSVDRQPAAANTPEESLTTSDLTPSEKEMAPGAAQMPDGTATIAETPTTDAAASAKTATATSESAAAETPGTEMPGPSVDNQARRVVSPQSGLSGVADSPVVENTASSEPRPIELLIPEKHFRKERGTAALRVTYDDIDLLKVLNMEPVPVDAVNHFPAWLKDLDGKTIRIRGFMYPTFEATGLTSFTLARDNGICCFVRQPKIYDIIGVTLSDNTTTDYIEGRPFDVEGTFHIDPQADEKDLSRLYRINNAKVLR